MKEKTEKDLEKSIKLLRRTLRIFTKMATIGSLTEIRNLSKDINSFVKDMRQV